MSLGKWLWSSILPQALSSSSKLNSASLQRREPALPANLGKSLLGPAHPSTGASAMDGWFSALVFSPPGAGRSPGLAQMAELAPWGSMGRLPGSAWHPKAM